MVEYWILNDEHELVPATIEQWGKWFEDFANRAVAQSRLDSGYFVSTVCLGMNLSFYGDDIPRVFETMVFSQVCYVA